MANGKRGAPLGNKNAAKGFAWKAAIERCVEAWPTKPDQEGKSKYIIGLETMAYMFVGKMVESRDIAFFREFGDRLDGKPTQAVTMDVDMAYSEIGALSHRLAESQEDDPSGG